MCEPVASEIMAITRARSLADRFDQIHPTANRPEPSVKFEYEHEYEHEYEIRRVCESV